MSNMIFDINEAIASRTRQAVPQPEREQWLKENPSAWGGDRPGVPQKELDRRLAMSVFLLCPRGDA